MKTDTPRQREIMFLFSPSQLCRTKWSSLHSSLCLQVLSHSFSFLFPLSSLLSLNNKLQTFHSSFDVTWINKITRFNSYFDNVLYGDYCWCYCSYSCCWYILSVYSSYAGHYFIIYLLLILSISFVLVIFLNFLTFIANAISEFFLHFLRLFLFLSFSFSSKQGKGGGPFPGLPFGFDVSLSFAKQSESMIFSDPNLCATRTRVLDYFQMQRSIIPPEHVMFRWEQSQQVFYFLFFYFLFRKILSFLFIG